jgi:replicative DNA helicase|tara:strand:- start:629 stop:1930 length:1302 start_codon:yes stop_codon:yes gene_type:complete
MTAVLPSSKEAESAVLGAILCDGASAYEKAQAWIRNVSAFHSERNRKIWQCIEDVYHRRSPIDTVTVVEAYKKKFNSASDDIYYITGLYDSVPTTANIEEYSRIVWEKFIHRKSMESAHELYKISSSTDDIDLVLEDHSKLISELQDLRPSRRRGMDIIASEAYESLVAGNHVIPYGISALDKPAGGMTRKEVTVLGGRPSHGKSTMMINIVKSLIEQDYHVMMFNREMSNNTMVNKLVVIESDDLIYDMLRKGVLDDPTNEKVHSLTDFIGEKYKKLTMYDDIRSLDETMIEIARYKPDVIVDDYIQLIDVKGKKDRRFELEAVMNDYKWVCKNENCSALLVSQLSRDIERRLDPTPRMSDYSESGVIEQTAESALFVFYGWIFDHQKYGKYESMIISAKTRYGQIGRFRVGFNGDRCKFYSTKEEAEVDDV